MKFIAFLSLFSVFATIFYLDFFSSDELIEAEVEDQREEIQSTPSPQPIKTAQVKKIIKKKKVKIKKKKPLQIRPQVQRKFQDEKDFAPQDKNGIYITQVLVDGDHLIAHGDIIVGDIKDIDSYQNGERPLIIPTPKLWPKGIVPIVIDPSITNQEVIKSSINELERLTNIEVKSRESEKDYIRIKRGTQHCYSQVGMIGGEQTISLSERCNQKAVLHEFMHSLGFLHEQNRLDRDDHVIVLWENIDEKNKLQFQKIRSNLWETKNIPFSFQTIMLYPSTAFSTTPDDYSMISINGDPFSLNFNTLTREDIRRINLLYPKEKEIE